MDPLAPIPGEDPAFLDALEHLGRLAAVDRACLVVGERGTGKELFATRLHYLSPRWGRALEKVNCAALAETLLESELFGHEAGAFTGATRRHRGCFERADGGTLVLDEIASASQAVQEKLLRVIEYGELQRVGGSETITVDVRVVGASNVDLPALAARGEFRADLLDRMSFDVVTLPPLRARPADILPLAEGFALEMIRALGREVFPGFSDAAKVRLMRHRWPGNVRELKNAVERAVYLSPPEGASIDVVVLDPFQSPWRPGVTPGGGPPAERGIGSVEAVDGARSATGPSGIDGFGIARPGLDPPGIDLFRTDPCDIAPTTTDAPAADDPANLAAAAAAADTRASSRDPEAPAVPFREAVAAFERTRLADALARAHGNQREAADQLGLGYHQLRRLLQKHALLPRRVTPG